jgi:hypothetical protein
VADPLLRKNNNNKKKVKEEGWPIHPQGMAGHPLGHGGGGVTEPPPVKEKKNVKEEEEQYFCILVNLFLHCKPLCVCLSCGIVKMKILVNLFLHYSSSFFTLFIFLFFLGVVWPPPWPKGWPATLLLSRVFFFSLIGGGLATPGVGSATPCSFSSFFLFFFFKIFRFKNLKLNFQKLIF